MLDNKYNQSLHMNYVNFLLSYNTSFASLTIPEQEEYKEWLSHEVFSESRRRIYHNHADLRHLKGRTVLCHLYKFKGSLYFGMSIREWLP